MRIYECDECAQEFKIEAKHRMFQEEPYPRYEIRHYYRDGDEPCFGKLIRKFEET